MTVQPYYKYLTTSTDATGHSPPSMFCTVAFDAETFEEDSNTTLPAVHTH